MKAALSLFNKSSVTEYISLISPVIVFGFNQTSYLIGEDDGAISAVVTFISGDAGVFTISANYTTQDGSALGNIPSSTAHTRSLQIALRSDNLMIFMCIPLTLHSWF